MNKITYVTRGGWNVAYISSSVRPGIVQLSVWRGFDERNQAIKGEHDGREFLTVDAAQEFAHEHGYLDIYQPKEVK